MPPFGRLPNGAGPERAECEPSKRTSQSEEGGNHAESTGVSGPDAKPSLAADAEIPKYDLAENILAEQRRVAARRRRAPTQAQDEPPGPPELSGLKPSFSELPSEDLPELQRIVAEIVARDIDRLCRSPDKWPHTRE